MLSLQTLYVKLCNGVLLFSLIFSWRFDEKPHIVTDSAFGSLQLFDEVEKWGGRLTSSISINKESWLWSLMGKNMPHHAWRAAISSKGVIASLHKDHDVDRAKVVSQQVFTNGFSASLIVGEPAAPQTLLSVGGKNLQCFHKRLKHAFL